MGERLDYVRLWKRESYWGDEEIGKASFKNDVRLGSVADWQPT